MTVHSYYAPQGGLPMQQELVTDRAVFTSAYAVIPKDVMQDIVTSYLPFWEDTRACVLSRPLSGFAALAIGLSHRVGIMMPQAI